MKIAMIIAPEGYQDIEFETPKKYFSDNKAIVDVFSTKKGLARGKLGGTFNVEHTLDELQTDNYDAIVFVGGPGTPLVRKEPKAIRITKEAFEKGKVVAAICWAPTILAKAGILFDKKATVWFGNDSEFKTTTANVLEKYGAKYLAEHVVTDGDIVTADGPGSTEEFAKAVSKAINH